MLKCCFMQSQANHIVFIKHPSHGKITALIVYVDDIVLTGDNLEEMKKLKADMSKEFEIKDLGSLKYFIGIEVARSRHGIFSSQRKCALARLEETGMLRCRACDTPIESNQKLGDDCSMAEVDKGKISKASGKTYLSLSYLS